MKILKKIIDSLTEIKRGRVGDLVVELPVADGELGPEEEGKLLVHDGLGSLLLCPFDLLQGHVPKR